MKLIRNPLLLATALVLVTLAWLALRPAPEVSPDVKAAASAEKATPGTAPSTGAATRRSPSEAASSARRPPAAPPAPASVFGEFLQAKQYRALYDRLKSSAEGETAEGRLVLW